MNEHVSRREPGASANRPLASTRKSRTKPSEAFPPRMSSRRPPFAPLQRDVLTLDDVWEAGQVGIQGRGCSGRLLLVWCSGRCCSVWRSGR